MATATGEEAAQLDAVLTDWATEAADDVAEKEARKAMVPHLMRYCRINSLKQGETGEQGERMVVSSGATAGAARQSSGRASMLLGRRSSSKKKTEEDAKEVILLMLQDIGQEELFAKFVQRGLTSVESCRRLSHHTLKEMGLVLFGVRQDVLDAFENWNGQAKIKISAAVSSIPALLYRGNLDLSNNEHVTELSGIVVTGDVFATGCKKLEALTDTWVEGNVNMSSCSALDKLNNLFVRGVLNVSECGKLAAITDDVQIGKSLVARECVTLMTLPSKMVLSDKLDLKGAACLRELPEELSVGGRIILKECEALESLPDGIVAGGSIGLRRCISLTQLPDTLHCKEHIDLHGCVSLETLPSTFTVDGWANLSCMDLLRELPRNFKVGSNLRLDETPIAEVPATLEVGGFLQMRRCADLDTLPDDLEVKASLELDECVSLHVLPAGLTVGKDLSLKGCTAISALPGDMKVGMALNIEGCTNITRLPDEVLQWGSTGVRMWGRVDTFIPHHIRINASGIPEEERQRLQMLANPNLQFHISLEEAQSLDSQPAFTTLEQGVAFWAEQAEIAEKSDYPVIDPFVSKANVRGVLLFLTKLRWSAEFRNQKLRVGLAKRVVEALSTVVDDEYAREEMVARMVDSVDACGDKPIWALNQMTLHAALSQARGDRDKLRSVARGVMNLGVVHKHVVEKMHALNFVDDVCVYLRFEIALQDRLGLPVSSVEMLFPKYINITDEEIKAAETEALAITDDAFEAWLAAWPEWQRQLRHEAADAVNFKDLKRNSRRFSLSFKDLYGETADQPVRLEKNGPVWSLKDLMRHWVATGMDMNNQVRSAEEMNRMTRCRSLPRGGISKPAKPVDVLPALGEMDEDEPNT